MCCILQNARAISMAAKPFSPKLFLYSFSDLQFFTQWGHFFLLRLQCNLVLRGICFLDKSNIKSNGENRRFDRCIVDLTNQRKSRLPLVAKSAFLQTATAAHISGPIYVTFLCSGSLKPGSFGYLRQTALALIGPI